ncbi:hypothetical protein [Candidatus Williamhamiltonella defendens]|nr:hypothetical protein [Candidatus Hamiltonella defensa]
MKICRKGLEQCRKEEPPRERAKQLLDDGIECANPDTGLIKLEI